MAFNLNYVKCQTLKNTIMNFENFTIKSQEVIDEAVKIADSKNQQIVEPEHLLKGVLKVGENITQFLMNKMGVNVRMVDAALDKTIDSFPKVRGKVDHYMSNTTKEVLDQALSLSQADGDQFVSMEYILLSLLLTSSKVSTLLKDAGMTEEALRQSIQEMRKGSNNIAVA